MNRRNFFFKTIVITTVLFMGAQVFNSCKKDNPVTTTADVVDTKGADNFKASVATATTLETLPAAVKTAGTTVTTVMPATQIATLAAVNVAPVLAATQAQVVIPTADVTKLQANDPVVYQATIVRILALPSNVSLSDAQAIAASYKAKPEYSQYLISAQTPTSSFYSGDYYQGALDAQKLMNDYQLPLLQKINDLRALANKSANMQQALTPEQQQLLAWLWGLYIANQYTLWQLFQTGLNAIHNA